MKITIEKKTDQLNYEDFLGGITRTVTVAGVKAGTKEQQYDIAIEGDRRAWRPPPTVLKLLVHAWGDDATVWVGRSALLYGDPDVKFGREKVGGIRVRALSDIEESFTLKLTATRGHRETFTIEPLGDGPQLITDEQNQKFLDTIHKAQDQAALNEIGKQLKTFDLGVYKVELQTAWSARSAELKQPVQGAIDDQEQAS